MTTYRPYSRLPRKNAIAPLPTGNPYVGQRSTLPGLGSLSPSGPVGVPPMADAGPDNQDAMMESAIAQLPEPQRSIYLNQWRASKMPQAPQMAPQDFSPHGFMERLGVGMAGSPFNAQIPATMPQGQQFAAGLLQSFANTLGRRGEQSYTARVTQDSANRKAQMDAYNQQVKAAQEGRQGVMKAIDAYKPPTPDVPTPAKGIKFTSADLTKYRGAGYDIPDSAVDQPWEEVKKLPWWTKYVADNKPVKPGLDDEVTNLVEGVRIGDLPITAIMPTNGRASDPQLRAQGILSKKYRYNVNDAFNDRIALTSYLHGKNSPTQLRMRQAVDNSAHTLDVIDSLNDEMNRTVPRAAIQGLNKVSISAAMNGAYGPEAANIAQKYKAAISDIASELGQVYMGGTSPTDKSIGIAQSNFNPGMTFGQVRSQTALTRQLLTIRRNSFTNVGPSGMSDVPATPPASDMVRMVSPSGKVFRVPAGKAVSDAKAKGWKEASQ